MEFRQGWSCGVIPSLVVPLDWERYDKCRCNLNINLYKKKYYEEEKLKTKPNLCAALLQIMRHFVKLPYIFHKEFLKYVKE